MVDKKGNKFKIFYGMSSESAMNKHHGGVASYRAAEGKTVKVPYRGLVQNTIETMLGGLRSACTYTGARSLKDLSKCATFIRVRNQVNNIYSKKLKMSTQPIENSRKGSFCRSNSFESFSPTKQRSKRKKFTY